MVITTSFQLLALDSIFLLLFLLSVCIALGSGSYPPPAHTGFVGHGDMYDTAGYNRSVYPSYGETNAWSQTHMTDASHSSPESLATSGWLSSTFYPDFVN